MSFLNIMIKLVALALVDTLSFNVGFIRNLQLQFTIG